MKKDEKTIKKTGKSTITQRVIWVIIFASTLLVIGITSALSSSHKSYLSTPIIGWSATTSLPQAIASKNAVAYDKDADGDHDYIFLVGGRVGNGAPTASVYAGVINTDGTISEWRDANPLPETLFLHSLDISGSHLYVIGGWKGATPTQRKVYSANIFDDGTIGAWAEQKDYPVKVSQHGSAVVNGYLYGIGGWEGTDSHSEVNYSPINSDGSLGEWKASLSLPEPIRRVAVATFNNRLYVTGGLDSNGNALNKVYVATPASDGSISAWTSILPLPQAMFYHQAVIHDGNLVVLGGKNVNDGPDLKVVYSASINPDGSLGSWTALTQIPQGLFRFAAVSLHRWNSDYIVVMGGGQGLNAGPTLQSATYYSSLPPTPTPTHTATPLPTSTPLPTPTPAVLMDVSVENSPGNWVAPGEEITYTIEYTNKGPGNASDTIVRSKIPANTTYIPGSSDPANSTLIPTAGGTDVSWSVGSLSAGQTGTVQYKVQRVELEQSQQSAIQVSLDGPSVGTLSQPLTYTLSVTTFVSGGFDSTNVTNIRVQLPPEASYQESTNGGSLTSENEIIWTASGLPEGLWSLDFVLTANASFVLHDYEVSIPIETNSPNLACCGVGRDVLTTKIDGQSVLGTGDGISIVNDEVNISWSHAGGPVDTRAAVAVQNPRLTNEKLFFPYVTK